MFGSRIFVGSLLGCVLLLSGCGGGGGGDNPPPATYSISGTIYSAAGNRVDSDVNDVTGAEPIDNDSIDSAQAIVSPVVIGGYVNVAGQGERGQSFDSGDPSDFFQVSLDADTVIRIALPDGTVPAIARIGLYLYNQAGTEVDSLTLSTEPNGLLSVADAGDYYIEVRILSGATTYRLMVGMPSAAVQSMGIDPAAEFVPGEVLVRLKTPSRATARRAMSAFAQKAGLRMVHANSGGWMRLRTDDVADTFDRLQIPPNSRSSSTLTGADRHRAGRQETLRIIQALRKDPDVAHAQPNYIRRPFYEPNDPLYPLQWHYNLIHLPAAWDVTRGSDQVIVAVIDSGVLLDHPDLQGKLVDGYDFISDDDNSGDGQPGIDNDPNDPGDSGFHGTHVAGTVAAAFNNHLGVAGVGGATMIMPVRVLGRDGGNDADIANAIRWAAGLPLTDANGSPLTDGNGDPVQAPDRPADIINMSFGGVGSSQKLADAIAAARAAGVILIAAAGNEGSNVENFPAADSNVISVAAVDADGRRAVYSNFGPTISLAAPGGNRYTDIQPDGYADGVLSTLGSDATGQIEYIYSYYDGTSMAVPHVAGVAALMDAVRLDLGQERLTPTELDGYIIGGNITADIGVVGKDDFYGAGLIDAYQAVIAAGSPAPTMISGTPAALRLDSTTTTGQLYLRQMGAGNITLYSVTDDAGWLTIAPDPGTTDFGQYTVTVHRTGLSGGIYTGNVTFDSSANSVTVPVSIDVLPDTQASASTQYLVLINAATNEAVAQKNLTPVNGAYAFSFTGLNAGSYYLLCGSDLDNDYLITDQGEAVGSYPSVENPTQINVQSDTSGLNFVTGFAQWPFFLPANGTFDVQ